MSRAFSAILIISSILIATTLFSVWTLANPPSGAPGTTSGAISATSSAGIWSVTINGTTTIQKILDMTNNRIINVALPLLNADAVNKAYIDSQIANISSSTTRIWGEGRPGTALVAGTACSNTAECYRDMNSSGSCNAGDIKIARSSRPASWDGSSAACPSNWWICTASERDINGATVDYGICGSGSRNSAVCDIPASTNNEIFAATTNQSWVADTATTNNREFGRTVQVNGTALENYICSLLPVWCCAYQ